MCTWDPDIETSVDVCDFKQTIESARHEKSKKTKMEIYAKAWKLYTGEFLPDMMGEDWAAVENIACRDMYFDCVEELCHYLKTEEKFEELLPCRTQRPEIYPFYDWQIWEIDSLIRNVPLQRRPRCLQKNNQADVRRTRPVTIRRNAQAIQTYGRRTSQATGAIEDIKYRLREKESIEGAYYCTYPSFVDVYHVFGRMMERNRHVRIPDALHPELYKYRDETTKIRNTIQNFSRESIQKAVRKGDFTPDTTSSGIS